MGSYEKFFAGHLEDYAYPQERIEEAIAEIIVKMGVKKLPLLPSRHTTHLMAKAAVAVYEAEGAAAAGLVAAENPHLYFEIQSLNDYGTESLTALLLALDQGESWGWDSFPIVILFIASVALLSAFLKVESRAGSPMLDLSLFRIRSFSASVASSLLNYICLNCALFLLPFYLIQGRGLDPARAGLILTAQPVIMMIVTPLSGRFSDRIGPRLPGTVGMAILAIGLFLLARVPRRKGH